MLADLKKWVAEGRDLDRDFRDANGATPVRTIIIVRALAFSIEVHVLRFDCAV